MTSIESLEKELKKGKLHSLYLLYGEELFLLENSLNKIKKLFGDVIKGINYVLIDDTNVKELIQDIETPAFGYEKKLIIAKNTGLFKSEGKKKNIEMSALKDKINDYLKENTDIISESVILVFVEEDAKRAYTVQGDAAAAEQGAINAYEFGDRFLEDIDSRAADSDYPGLHYKSRCAGANRVNCPQGSPDRV